MSGYTGAMIGGFNEGGKQFIDDPQGGVYGTDDVRELIGTVRNETVIRRVACLKGVAPDVANSLRGETGQLQIFVGKDSPIQYGEGWRMNQINPSNIGPSAMMFSTVYERERQGTWDFDLPSNVALGWAAGVVTVSYNGVPMESWDSGRATEEDAFLIRMTARVVDTDTVKVSLAANGVAMSDWNLPAPEKLDPENIADHRCRWVENGTTIQLMLLNVALYEWTSS